MYLWIYCIDDTWDSQYYNHKMSKKNNEYIQINKMLNYDRVSLLCISTTWLTLNISPQMLHILGVELQDPNLDISYIRKMI